MSYKKVKTVFIFDKPKCIYMKPKGTREYVKSKGEMVLLSAYIKKAEKIAAKKALASKMAKKSKASRWPNKRRSVYGGNDENNIDKEQFMFGGRRRRSLQIIPIRNNAQTNWAELSSNPAPDAIELLIANPHMINWPNLSGNPGAIELLIANTHRIDYNRFRNNPGVIAGDDRFIDLLNILRNNRPR